MINWLIGYFQSVSRAFGSLGDCLEPTPGGDSQSISSITMPAQSSEFGECHECGGRLNEPAAPPPARAQRPYLSNTDRVSVAPTWDPSQIKGCVPLPQLYFGTPGHSRLEYLDLAVQRRAVSTPSGHLVIGPLANMANLSSSASSNLGARAPPRGRRRKGGNGDGESKTAGSRNSNKRNVMRQDRSDSSDDLSTASGEGDTTPGDWDDAPKMAGSRAMQTSHRGVAEGPSGGPKSRNRGGEGGGGGKEADTHEEPVEDPFSTMIVHSTGKGGDTPVDKNVNCVFCGRQLPGEF